MIFTQVPQLKLTYSHKEKSDFYERIDLEINDDFYFLLDAGNKKIYKYDKKFKLISSYAKEGNGPGEFSSPSNITITKNRLIVKDFLMAHIFDFDFNFKASIKTLGIVFIEEEKKQLIFYNRTYDSSTLAKEYYDLDGNQSESTYLDNNTAIPKVNASEAIKKFRKFTSMTKLADKIFKVYPGDYKITLEDATSGELLKSVTKSYPKVKFKRENIKLVSSDAMTAEQTKMLYERYFAQRIKSLDEYENDITWLTGSVDNKFLIIETALEESNRSNYHIYDLELNYIAETSIDHKDNYEHTLIKANQLIVFLKSDEVGPYFNIYRLELKEESN